MNFFITKNKWWETVVIDCRGLHHFQTKALWNIFLQVIDISNLSNLVQDMEKGTVGKKFMC